MATDSSSQDDRGESELERLDRNTVELLNELRVASTGIQVMFAFLLIVPFNSGYSRLSKFDRYEYFATLLCIAMAAILLIAPSIYHRLLFRRHEKPYIVEAGNRAAIVAAVFLSIGMTGILILISHVMFGASTATVVGIGTAIVVVTVWFAIPLRRRLRHGRRFSSETSG